VDIGFIFMTVFQPRQFGKYQLLDRIAVGGMAELYRAKLTGERGFEKLIAIKKILPNLSDEESLVTSFIDEAKLAALLHHENIVQIYDFGSMDNEYFIAMEFLFGKDLRTIRKNSESRKLPLGLENAIYIVSRICAGLDYSHNLKDLQGQPLHIIHRDINPQNILVTYDGQVKIIDYGIAKAASQNNKTKENLIKGKLAYMSPEQASGRAIDHRSDIFSTGIILYELLAVRRMFTGETMQVLSLVRNAQFEPPEKVIPFLPAKLDEILHQALAKDPDDRYQSAGEMLADVEELAFELKLRPNARSFAQFLKELFEEEFAEEETALWAKSAVDEAGENNQKDQPAPGTYDNTVVLTRSVLLEKLNRFKQILVKGIWPQLVRFNQIVIKGLRAQLAKIWRIIKRNPAKKANRAKRSVRTGFKLGVLKPGLVVIVFLAVVGLGIKQLSFSRSQPENTSSGFTAEVVEEPVDASAADVDGPEEPPAAVVEESVELSKIRAGNAALEAQRYTQALTLFEEVLASDPALMKDISESYVNALLGRAAELIGTDAGQAQKILLKALKIDPDNISGLSNLGYLYMGRKNYPKAIEAYLKVADLAPHLPDTFFNLGYVYAVRKNYQQAKVMYRRVVDLNPAFTDEALFNLAVINEKLGEHKQCIKNLQRAIALNPGNESAKKYLRHLKKKTGDKTG
jgi:serine/threonine protein kinase/Tfp pilus assembly protein PilF